MFFLGVGLDWFSGDLPGFWSLVVVNFSSFPCLKKGCSLNKTWTCWVFRQGARQGCSVGTQVLNS